MKLQPIILGLIKKNYQRNARSHTWNCNNINQSEASIHSLLRKVSDYSDNLNLV